MGAEQLVGRVEAPALPRLVAVARPHDLPLAGVEPQHVVDGVERRLRDAPAAGQPFQHAAQRVPEGEGACVRRGGLGAAAPAPAHVARLRRGHHLRLLAPVDQRVEAGQQIDRRAAVDERGVDEVHARALADEQERTGAGGSRLS